MKYFYKVPSLLFIFFLLVFSSCSDDDEPEPKPQSYVEFAGRVYELRTALFVSQNPPNDKQLLLEFYSLTQEELNALSDPASNQQLGGDIVSIVLRSPEAGQVGEGNYTYSLEGEDDLEISGADIVIGYDQAKKAGIFLYPVAGTVNIVEREGGHLVDFEFTLTNEEKVTGRFQGELVKMN